MRGRTELIGLQIQTGIVIALIALVGPTAADSTQGLPEPLTRVGFDQHLGAYLPLELQFEDSSGESVVLGDFFGDRPVVLVPVYYNCPMLCTMVLNGVTSTLKVLDFDPGDEFEVVVVSFDSTDTAKDAHQARLRTLKRYGRPRTEAGWHFLTGNAENILQLFGTLGFRFTEIEDSEDFAHAAGIVTLTPEGKIARYHYGIEYSPRDLKLGLIEAADNKIGSVVDQVLLYCFHYDPVTGTYSAVAINIVRLGAAITVLALALFLFVQWQREKRRHSAAVEA